MTSKECDRYCMYNKECDINGGKCPEELEISLHKAMEQENQMHFGAWDEERRLEFVHEYRKLDRLSNALADGEDSPFDLVLDAIESYFPAYEWDQIHSENNDINDNYTQLLELSRDENVSDKDFHDRVIRKVF